MKTIYSIIFFLCASATAWSQNNPRQQALVWEYNEFVNGRSQETLHHSGTLTTDGESSVVWTQDDNYTQSFEVQSVSGTWADVAQDGELTYAVRIDESSGTINVRRSGGAAQIQIDLARPGRPASQFTFSITQVHP